MYRPLAFETVDARIWMELLNDVKRWSTVAG